MSNRIESFDEFTTTLGDRFILFCGSAVSAFSADSKSHFLPLVSDVTEYFFARLAVLLNKGSYYQQLLAEYSKLLVDGKYCQIRFQTKFEGFIWQIQNLLSSTEQTANFLKALFLCQGEQFTYNHAALSALLENRNALACITTNFDNALELAFPEIDKYVHPRIPTDIDLTNKPCILKLHGDVIQGNYTATIPELFSLKQIKAYDYLLDLCLGKTILVIGYSGYGDIDISPHLYALKKQGAKILWMGKSDNQRGIPSFANYWFQSDLSMNDERKNWLVGLSNHFDLKRRKGDGRPAWKFRVNNWMKARDIIKLQEVIVSELYYGGAIWAIPHVHNVKRWEFSKFSNTKRESNDSVVNWELGVACVRTGFYFSAQRAFDTVNIEMLSDDQKAEMFIWRGFIYWRLGKLYPGLDELMPFIESNQLAITRNRMAEGLRIYIEISRDIMSFMLSKTKRKKFYGSRNLSQLSENLIELFSDNKDEDIQNYYLSLLVLLHIKILLKEKVLGDEIEEIYETSKDLHLYVVAAEAARILLNVNFLKGFSAIREINQVLYRRKDWIGIVKNLVAILHRLTKLKYFFILNIDGPPLGTIKINIRERQYRKKMKQWGEFYKSSTNICS